MSKKSSLMALVATLLASFALVGCIDSPYGHGSARRRADPYDGNLNRPLSAYDQQRRAREREDRERESYNFEERRQQAYEAGQRRRQEHEGWERERRIWRDRDRRRRIIGY